MRRVALRARDGGQALLRIDGGEVWIEKVLEGGWIAAFRILPAADGSPIVSEVRVFPGRTLAGREPGEWWGSNPNNLRPPRANPVPKGGLTSRLMRDVKPPGVDLFARNLMKEYAAAWRELGLDADAILFSPVGLSSESPEPERRRIGRPRISNEELAYFAHCVLQASRTSRSPVEDVSIATHKSVDNGRKWLSKAVERGLLKGRVQGSAVGWLTPEGEAALARFKAQAKKHKDGRSK